MAIKVSYDDTSDFIGNIKNLFIRWDKFLEDNIENNFKNLRSFQGKYL